MFFEWRAGESLDYARTKRRAVIVDRLFRMCAIRLWPRGGVAAGTSKDSPHLGRLLRLRARSNRTRRRDARSGDEFVGLRTVVADHGRGGRHVHGLARREDSFRGECDRDEWGVV